MEEKNLTVISRINAEIEKINNKESNIYFFVVDTKGNPSGALEYIYKLALILKDNGYNVSMLYQENEEFVGVGEWLGDKYSSLPHYNIEDGEISVSASDVLFIPELFSNIMMQTKKLPCKRIAITQNYDFILEQMPVSAQWGDLGIMESVVNTEVNAELLKGIFPYVKTTVIDPYVDNMFGETNAPKKMIVNIISKDQKSINRIIKPFYWKYPMYKWVTFRDLRGYPKEMYSTFLRESAITIWCDEDTNFGYSALEAMKSGSLVISKVTNEKQQWMLNENGTLDDCCVWFDSFNDLSKIIASVIRAWITDNVPSEIAEIAKEKTNTYSYEKTEKQFVEYVNNVLETRKNEMNVIITQVNKEGGDNE
ncbi:MAG: hypothetical protein IKT40_02655 [Bacilli bacterium]|nr:hypothetical protein [Bacilli bacterium]